MEEKYSSATKISTAQEQPGSPFGFRMNWRLLDSRWDVESKTTPRQKFDWADSFGDIEFDNLFHDLIKQISFGTK